MVIQPAVTVAKTREDIRKNLDRVCNLIDFGVGYFWERPVRLIVLPEYFLQGVTTPGKGEAGSKGGSKGVPRWLSLRLVASRIYSQRSKPQQRTRPRSLAKGAATETSVETPNTSLSSERDMQFGARARLPR